MKKMTPKTFCFLATALCAFSLSSCKKNDSQPAAPGSDDVAPANLVSKFSFEGDYSESKTGNTGTGTNTSLITGMKGKAYQGSSNGFVSFATTPAGLSNLQSFTTSMWIKTAKHTGGLQSLFCIPNTASYMGNLLVMIDPNPGTSDSMQLKVYFEKNVTPAISWYGQLIDFYGEFRLPNMYGSWKQLAFSYDAATSKFAAYMDGNKLALDEGMVDHYTDDPSSGGVPLSALSFANVSRFIIGGFQQHLGTPWTAPDPDMLTYTGAMDELRIYNKALTDTEVHTLYQTELSGK